MFRPTRRTLVVLTLILLGLSPLTLAAESLTPELLVDLKSVSSVALSPDGTEVAYLLTVPRAADDDPGRSYSELWVVSADGGDARQFVSGKQNPSSIAWSPDGKLISFQLKRASVSENTQVFALPVNGGEAKALTDHGSSISLYAWSPDGNTIAFVAPRVKSKEEKDAIKAGKDWKVDGDITPRELWIHDTTSGESSKLLDSLQVWSLVWAPDGKQLVVQASEGGLMDDSMLFRQIYAVATDGGEPRQITTTPGKLGAMEVSPDGSQLAFLGAVTANDPLAQSLFLAPMSGGDARNLTDGVEASAFDLAWSTDGKLLLAMIERENHRLYEVDARSGKRKAAAWADAIIGDLDLRGSRLAAAANAPSHPGEVYAGKLGQTPTRRTFHNPALENVALTEQEAIRWTGADGWEIGGVLTYPKGYKVGQRYPLVLQIHGGPEGVSLNGWRTRPTYPVQLLADAGFMVLEPNYRGSAGRGVAFSKADHDDLGGKEFEDVLAGIDALIDRGMVDGDRVGTGGWSYGGYFSAWAATRHSERFKASMVGAGLTNWISFAGTTDIPYEMATVHWDSWWQQEPELHWERSPLAHINKARTPTLVVHGEKDTRVDPEQGVQLYTALRIKDVPTSLVLYPREPHGLTERAHELDYIERIVGWYREYVVDDTADAGTR